jgi:RimJ/RimL family protein N-acetyltransferase
VIETQRLFIRPFTRADAEELLEIWGDPANERFIGEVSAPSSVAQVRAWVDEGMPWGVWEREGGALVGDCGLFFDEGHGEWELAYGFRRNRWGRGYASEAAEACVRHGFERMGLEKIVADVDPANAASVRVLEKLGFQQTGEKAGKVIYELTRETSR